MRTAGRFKEAFPGLVDLDRPGCGVLGSDRARQHVGEDASGVMVPARLATRRIVHGNCRQRLTGHVGKFLRADQLDIVLCRRGVPPGRRSGQQCADRQQCYPDSELLTLCD
jgi:hypothetical protein